MANEGLLQFDWPDTGLLTFTVDLLVGSDSSIRQADIAFSDAGHLGRYVNTTSIPTILAGDTMKVYLSGVWKMTDEFQPEVTVDNIAAIADAVLAELVADHSGTSGSLAEFVELIKDIAEADTVIDTSDDAQWILIFNKKGTSTEIMRKKMIDINGAAITATTAVVGAHEHTT